MKAIDVGFREQSAIAVHLSQETQHLLLSESGLTGLFIDDLFILST